MKGQSQDLNYYDKCWQALSCLAHIINNMRIYEATKQIFYAPKIYSRIVKLSNQRAGRCLPYENRLDEPWIFGNCSAICGQR